MPTIATLEKLFIFKSVAVNQSETAIFFDNRSPKQIPIRIVVYVRASTFRASDLLHAVPR